MLVGLRRGGSTWALAERDGFKPRTVSEAVKDADIVAMLVPDMAQPRVWQEEIAAHLRQGAMLLFAHGFAIHYGRITPPREVDVTLIAPKAPGRLVRRTYTQGHGVPCLLAVHQDATGHAKDRALGYARGIGGTRAAVLETTFGEETVGGVPAGRPVEQPRIGGEIPDPLPLSRLIGRLPMRFRIPR